MAICQAYYRDAISSHDSCVDPPPFRSSVNRFERIKQDKDGLDAREALDRGAHLGRVALSDDDLFRLKWLAL